MKRFYLRIRISLMTFAFGLASVFAINILYHISENVPVDLPKVESSSVIEIITKENWKGFQMIGHSCGGRNEYDGESWATGYRTNEWRSVSISGSSHDTKVETQNEFDLRIKNAFRIIELDERRAVIENQRDGKTSVNIILYEQPKSLRIITATKLETAIEFEVWFKSNQ